VTSETEYQRAAEAARVDPLAHRVRNCFRKPNHDPLFLARNVLGKILNACSKVGPNIEGSKSNHGEVETIPCLPSSVFGLDQTTQQLKTI
jgi:hypothetical protein